MGKTCMNTRAESEDTLGRRPGMKRPRGPTLVLTLLLTLLLLPTPAAAAEVDASFRVQLKKINQYLEDQFCADALAQAQETLLREGAAEQFALREAIAKAQLCLGAVLETLTTLDETEQQLPVTPEERARLNLLRDQVRSEFGELRLRLPGGRRAPVRTTLEQVGPLSMPGLQPYVTQVQARLASGTVRVPETRLFLPRGTYRIDEVPFEIQSFEGITFVLGRERPPALRRLVLGDGQALGIGYLSLTGWQGTGLQLSQLSGGTQEVIGVDRLGTSGSAFLEASHARVWRWGTLGYVGTKLDLQWRPGVSLPGDVVTGTVPGLTPAWAGLGMSLRRQQPLQGGFSVGYGAGLRLLRYDWMEYLAIVSLEESSGGTSSGSGETINVSRMPIYMPTWGGGLELLATSGWQLLAGKQPIQVGLELRGGLAALVPSVREGEQRLDTGDGELVLRWRLYQERLWGSTLSTLLTVRIPLF